MYVSTVPYPSRIYGCKFTTFFGASNRNRTCNPLFTKQMLCQLSYRSLSPERDSNPRMSVLRTDRLAASPSELLLGLRDSNSHRRFWRPLCCRCTMPQRRGRCEIRTHGTLSSSSVFWTGALNQLGQPSGCGSRKIRTFGTLCESSTLAGCRLRPLGHTSVVRE